MVIILWELANILLSIDKFAILNGNRELIIHIQFLCNCDSEFYLVILEKNHLKANRQN